MGHNDWQLVRLCLATLLLVKSGTPYRNPTVMAAVDPGHRRWNWVPRVGEATNMINRRGSCRR